VEHAGTWFRRPVEDCETTLWTVPFGIRLLRGIRDFVSRFEIRTANIKILSLICPKAVSAFLT
jgi:hypothetical protein